MQEWLAINLNASVVAAAVERVVASIVDDEEI